MADQRIGGEGGIRTPGTVPRTLDFESSAFNRTRPPLRLGGHTSGLLFAFKPFLVFIGTTLLVSGCSSQTPARASSSWLNRRRR